MVRSWLAKSEICDVAVEPFLAPRLTGPRFEGGAVPLHVLADFTVLEQMIVDIAKWKFRSGHPTRKRAPRGFTDGISLKLTSVESGSAIPVINLFFTATSLFPPAAKNYFEDARDALIESIREAELGKPITKLPPDMLGHFARFGRSLEPGEALVFEDNETGRQAKLTQESRHRLVIASTVKEYTGDVILHGTVPEVDQENKWFQVGRIDGTRVRAPLTETNFVTIMDAFNSYSSGQKVRLYATGRFDRDRRLRGIESIDQVVLLDPLDVRARIEELKLLKNGWHDGRGVTPPPAMLDWIVYTFEERYPDDLVLPYLFPIPAGNLLAEWSFDDWSLSLEIDWEAKRGLWHAMDLSSNEEVETVLELASEEQWFWLVDQIRSIGGVVE